MHHIVGQIALGNIYGYEVVQSSSATKGSRAVSPPPHCRVLVPLSAPDVEPAADSRNRTALERGVEVLDGLHSAATHKIALLCCPHPAASEAEVLSHDFVSSTFIALLEVRFRVQ